MDRGGEGADGPMIRSAAIALLAAFARAQESAVARLLDAASGQETTIAAVADAFARRDVVFFGEQHDSADSHLRELELTEELFARRPDLVLSFEMFERDCQGVVDDYLAG